MNKITNQQIVEKGNQLIDMGYNGKAIVAFVDMLGFSKEIKSKWDSTDDNPLQRIMEIKGFIDLAKNKAKKHEFFDYDEKTLIGEANYPEVITISDSFVFIQVIDNDDAPKFILSLLTVTASINELWRISKDKGFTIRGGVEFGDLFYSKKEIIGPAFIDAYNLEAKVAVTSRVVYSDTISNLIYTKKNEIPTTLTEYLGKWFKKDDDDQIILNPLIPFYPYEEASSRDFVKMMNNAPDIAKNMYQNLIDQLNKKDQTLSDIEIFNKTISKIAEHKSL